MRKKIFILITDSGGGHRGTANSLKAAIEQRGLTWDVHIINVFRDIRIKNHLAYLIVSLLGTVGENIYNFILKHDLLFCSHLCRKTVLLLVKLCEPRVARIFEKVFSREKPDMVLSLMPFMNGVYSRALAHDRTYFGLLITDLIDTRPFMWLNPRICNRADVIGVSGEEAADQARRQGAGDRVLECGLVIHPNYFSRETRGLTPAQARHRFGLSQELFTVMILMGGFGSSIIASFVKQFEKSSRRWQIVACCGRNEKLFKQIGRMAPKLKNKVKALGFCRELPGLMRSADLMITKPGPASIMEALAVQTPLVLDNYETMPQEIPNVDFVVRNKLGLAVLKRKEMFQAVNTLFKDPSRLEALRTRMKEYGLRDASEPLINTIYEKLYDKPSTETPISSPETDRLWLLPDTV